LNRCQSSTESIANIMLQGGRYSRLAAPQSDTPYLQWSDGPEMGQMATDGANMGSKTALCPIVAIPQHSLVLCYQLDITHIVRKTLQWYWPKKQKYPSSDMVFPIRSIFSQLVPAVKGQFVLVPYCQVAGKRLGGCL